jgi:hypothetical protein
LGFGIWDLDFGIFQRSNPPIEISDGLFEHGTVRGCAGTLQVSERARSRQRERCALSQSRAFVRRDRHRPRAALSGGFLLRFD